MLQQWMHRPDATMANLVQVLQNVKQYSVIHLLRKWAQQVELYNLPFRCLVENKEISIKKLTQVMDNWRKLARELRYDNTAVDSMQQAAVLVSDYSPSEQVLWKLLQEYEVTVKDVINMLYRTDNVTAANVIGQTLQQKIKQTNIKLCEPNFQ